MLTLVSACRVAASFILFRFHSLARTWVCVCFTLIPYDDDSTVCRVVRRVLHSISTISISHFYPTSLSRSVVGGYVSATRFGCLSSHRRISSFESFTAWNIRSFFRFVKKIHLICFKIVISANTPKNDVSWNESLHHSFYIHLCAAQRLSITQPTTRTHISFEIYSYFDFEHLLRTPWQHAHNALTYTQL